MRVWVAEMQWLDLSGAATVDYAVSSTEADGVDFGGAFPSDTVSFDADEVTKTITINVTGDTVVEPDESFTVTLSNASAPATITTASAEGTIQNDDSTSLAIAPQSAVLAEGDSGTTALTFTVTRSGDLSGAATVDYAVSSTEADGVDFGGAFPTDTVSFDADEVTKTITINVTGDTVVEPDESFTVTLSNASAPATITTASAVGTILNDDVSAVSNTAPVLSDAFAPALPSIDEGNLDPVGVQVRSIVVDGSLTDPDIPAAVSFREGNTSSGGDGYTTGAVTIRKVTNEGTGGDQNENSKDQIIIGLNEPLVGQREKLRGLFEFDLLGLTTQIGAQTFDVTGIEFVVYQAAAGRNEGAPAASVLDLQAYLYGHDFDEAYATYDHPSAVDGSSGTDLTEGGSIGTPEFTSPLSTASVSAVSGGANQDQVTFGATLDFQSAFQSAVATGTPFRLLVKADPTIEDITAFSSGFDAHFARFASESHSTESLRPELNASLAAQEAIAITGTDNDNGGQWQYRLQGESSWNAMGARSDEAALLLGPNDEIRFVPAPGYSGTPSFAFRGWDQSTGTPGATQDVTINGGQTAFSATTDTAFITVNDVSIAETQISLDGSGDLLVEDINGGNSDDTLVVSLNGVNLRIQDLNNELIAIGDVIQVDSNTVEVPTADITGTNGVIINSLGGDDRLTIDFTGGNVAIPILFHGGSQSPSGAGDQLILQGGGTFASGLFQFDDPGSGTIDLTDNGMITYTGLEPLFASVSVTDVTLQYSESPETISVNSSINGLSTSVQSTLAGTLEIANPTGTLQLLSGDVGDDLVQIDGLPIDYPSNLILDGQGGSDTVAINPSVSLAVGKSFNVSADDITLPNGTSSVATSGIGEIQLIADRSITLSPGASLLTVDGGISLQSNASGLVSGDFVGISLDAAHLQTSGSGTIQLSGSGGNAGDNTGVSVQGGAIVESTSALVGAGGIVITGVGRVGVGSDGVRIVGSQTVVQSSMGAIQIEGSTGDDDGVVIANDSQIKSLGAGPDAATITINGVSGTTNSSVGVAIGNGAEVTSSDGDIQIGAVGTGGQRSLYAFNGAEIKSTGTTSDAADVRIDANGGSDDAIELGDLSGGALISALSGDLTIISDASPDGSSGINLFNGSTIQVSDGTLRITSSGGSPGGVQQPAIVLSSTSVGKILSLGDGDIEITASAGEIRSGGTDAEISVIGGDSAAGSITLIANEMALDGGNVGGSVRTTGVVAIKPLGAATTIGLGGGVGTLNLNDSELSRIHGATIEIGDQIAGTGSIDVDTATFNAAIVIAGGVLHDAESGVDLIAPNIELNTDVSPGQSPGVLSLDGNVTIGANRTLELEIGGTLPGTLGSNHDQLVTTGTLDIGNLDTLSMAAIGGFVPVDGDQFMIIQRNGGSGAFAGLPESALIVDFLGAAGIDGTISYVGGDGDDVVISAASRLMIVDTLADTPDANPGDGVAQDAAGNTSLRAAIEEANVIHGHNTIQFADSLTSGGPATIVLNGSSLSISDDLTVTGPGLGVLSLSAAQNSRVITVSADSDVNIAGLTIRDGEDNGAGGIDNHGNLTLSDVLLTNNTATGSLIPGIGTFPNITYITIPGFGGAIYNRGDLNLTRVTLSANAGDKGAAIFNTGTTSLNASLVDSNVGLAQLTTPGEVLYTSTPDGVLNIVDSTISNNVGGGIELQLSGTANVERTLIAGNEGPGARIGQSSSSSNPGILNLVNSTISGNTVAGSGGGLLVFADSTVTIDHSTITQNRADSFGGATGAGGGIYSTNATINIHNSVIARNYRGTSTTPDDIAGDPVTSSFYSLIGDTASAGGIIDGVNGNIVGADPRLGPLADNGGNSFTHKPLPGSALIDVGDENFTQPPDIDQRGVGFSRVRNARLDIGAVEVQDVVPPAPAPRIVDVGVGSTSWNQAFRDAIDADGQGMMLTGSNDQLRDVPFINADQIFVRFDQPIAPTDGGQWLPDDIQLIGSPTLGHTYSFSDVEFLSGSNTLVLTIDGMLVADKLLLHINASRVMGLDQSLDGEWATDQSDPSGDGAAGGDFNFRFDVLPGNFNNDLLTNTTDLSAIRALGTQIAGITPDFNMYANVNGDLLVNTTDLSAIRSLGTQLLIGIAEPTQPAPSSPGISKSFAAASNYSGLAASGIDPTEQNTDTDSFDLIASLGLDVVPADLQQESQLRSTEVDAFFATFTDTTGETPEQTDRSNQLSSNLDTPSFLPSIFGDHWQ
ncbi:Calx-beta domain-containing protein [Stieleria varia]|nr:choice-of-anchor Q domain-containing protein [Stieleria varia]